MVKGAVFLLHSTFGSRIIQLSDLESIKLWVRSNFEHKKKYDGNSSEIVKLISD